MNNAKPLADELTVDALLAQLQRISAAGQGAAKVRVPYVAAYPADGVSQCVGVQAVTAEFDWNHSRVYLQPSRALSGPAASRT